MYSAANGKLFLCGCALVSAASCGRPTSVRPRCIPSCGADGSGTGCHRAAISRTRRGRQCYTVLHACEQPVLPAAKVALSTAALVCTRKGFATDLWHAARWSQTIMCDRAAVLRDHRAHMLARAARHSCDVGAGSLASGNVHSEDAGGDGVAYRSVALRVGGGRAALGGLLQPPVPSHLCLATSLL